MRCIAHHLIGSIGALALGLLTVAASAQSNSSPKDLHPACGALAGLVVPATTIALPTNGAMIATAEIATFAATTGVAAAAVEYCKVLGAIAPVDPAGYPINVEINLPLAWNQGAVQYGGGGFNGVLITGLDPLRDAPLDVSPPLGRGFMTFGTDSGHQNNVLPEIPAFALNDEALLNYAHASYKKTHDLAIQIAKAFYGRAPQRMYYFGDSEGGREGLAMAQRYPADFDGIVAVVPVINFVGLQSAGNRSGVVQQNGGWLKPAKVTLLHKAAIAACDALDGLADGIVSKYLSCVETFKPQSLRCSDGKDTGDTCLSDAQIKAVETLHQPYPFKFALANGVRSYPGWSYGGEDQPDGMVPWVTGAKPAQFPLPAPADQGRQWYFGSGMIRYFIARDASFNTLNFDPDKFKKRILQISALMDSTDPDLSRFYRRGGKLIMKENGADFAQSPFAGFAYYNSVVREMGAKVVDRFIRLYVTPGATHGGAGVSGTDGSVVPRGVDLLGVLDDWVAKGAAPGVLTQVAQAASSPFSITASRPMCRYPDYPRHIGGATTDAKNFVCTKP